MLTDNEQDLARFYLYMTKADDVYSKTFGQKKDEDARAELSGWCNIMKLSPLTAQGDVQKIKDLGG